MYTQADSDSAIHPRLVRLVVRTPGFQPGNGEFNSPTSHPFSGNRDTHHVWAVISSPPSGDLQRSLNRAIADGYPFSSGCSK